VERSPFYRALHAGLEQRPLHELPIVTKAALMERFDEVVTDPAVRLADVERHMAALAVPEPYLGRYWVAATSGTTGRRGIFVWNREEWTAVLASFARANDWAGVEAGLATRLKLAVVSSRTPWHQSALAGATLQSRWVQTLRLDATEPIERIVAELNRQRPSALVAYASIARVLAEEQIAGRLGIAPRGVMCASEVLTLGDRARIEKAWGVQPFNVYAATEPAGIASECGRHHGMHLYEDLVITEVVDHDNRPVPFGTFGAKVLVTVLFGRTLPLIRYEISDRVSLMPGTCVCGRPFARIAEVEGRREDVASLPARDGGRVMIRPNVFHTVLGLLPLAGWQVIVERDALRVLLAGAGAAVEDGALAERLSRALTEQGASKPVIQVERVDEIPRTRLGKAPLVVVRDASLADA
jgi:phenylacetate-coenzyme A ligase PaaK-like adenylate-forming protein